MKMKLLFSLAIAALCLWLAVRNTRMDEVSVAFKDIQWGYAVLIFALFFVTYAFRTLRWQVILGPVKKIPFWELYAINIVGFLAISLFPLRLGELIRPLLFKQRHGISITTGLAAVGVERVLDSLICAFILVLGFSFAPIGSRVIPVLHLEIHSAAYALLGSLAAVTGFLIFGVIAQRRAIGLICRGTWFLSVGAQSRLILICQNFFRGLHSFADVKSLSLLLLFSFGVWIPMILAYQLGLYAFGWHLHWSGPFVIMGIAVVGVMLPGAPAAVGTYQLFVQEAVALFGVSRSVGFAYSVVLQAINLSFLVGVGLPLLPKMSTGMGALYREASKGAEQNETP